MIGGHSSDGQTSIKKQKLKVTSKANNSLTQFKWEN